MVIRLKQLRLKFSSSVIPWHSLTEGKVTMYWYKGGDSFIQELMAAAQQALTRLAEDTGAHLEQPVKVYIYANFQDLKGAMIYPREWTGGVAYTRYGIIAIGIDPLNLHWGKRAIAHELAHLIIHQMTLNPYSDLPTWLDEGLAMLAEGVPAPGYKTSLARAIAEDSLISVRSLSSPFSAHPEQALLSYAQSYSLVRFLIDNYGKDKMLELLNTFSQGSSYDGALEEVYGFDMDGLDTLWREYVTAPLPEEAGMPPVLIGVLVALAVGFLFGLGLAIKYGGKGW
ncbi:peptidase MA family metallohydrolase [Dehalococcoidales bacterium]|nr:peptidase MA family metallohydrolase [Dehalococcoidales bacterium]